MNTSALRALAAPYRQYGLLLDANLLLVYVVSNVEPGLVGIFKRTRIYQEVAGLLLGFAENFERFVTTPSILTEVSNLGGQIPGSKRREFFLQLQQQILIFDERYLPSCEISAQTDFLDLGLTDAGILQLSAAQCLVLTEDGELRRRLEAVSIASMEMRQLLEAATRPS